MHTRKDKGKGGREKKGKGGREKGKERERGHIVFACACTHASRAGLLLQPHDKHANTLLAASYEHADTLIVIS